MEEEKEENVLRGGRISQGSPRSVMNMHTHLHIAQEEKLGAFECSQNSSN